MSILDDLAERGILKAESALADPLWVDRAVATGSRALGGMDASVRSAVTNGLAVLAGNKDLLARTTGETFAAVAARLSLGHEDAARRAWLLYDATFEEQGDVLARDHAAVEARAVADARAWADAKEVAVRFLEAAGQVAVPLLLALV